MATTPANDRARFVSVKRLVITGGATAAVAFILCWISTFISFASPTHAYIRLFTLAEPRSFAALSEGALWSLLFGALVGGLFGLIYNATAPLGRK